MLETASLQIIINSFNIHIFTFQANLAAMLETASLQRQQMVVDAVKNKLDYHKAVQGVDKELAQSHMVEWVENQVMQAITPDSVSIFM